MCCEQCSSGTRALLYTAVLMHLITAVRLFLLRCVDSANAVDKT